MQLLKMHVTRNLLYVLFHFLESRPSKCVLVIFAEPKRLKMQHIV